MAIFVSKLHALVVGWWRSGPWETCSISQNMESGRICNDCLVFCFWLRLYRGELRTKSLSRVCHLLTAWGWFRLSVAVTVHTTPDVYLLFNGGPPNQIRKRADASSGISSDVRHVWKPKEGFIICTDAKFGPFQKQGKSTRAHRTGRNSQWNVIQYGCPYLMNWTRIGRFWKSSWFILQEQVTNGFSRCVCIELVPCGPFPEPSHWRDMVFLEPYTLNFVLYFQVH